MRYSYLTKFRQMHMAEGPKFQSGGSGGLEDWGEGKGEEDKDRDQHIIFTFSGQSLT